MSRLTTAPLLAAMALSLGFVAGIAKAEPSEILLPEVHPFPESMTSTEDGTLYVSSFSNGGVLRVKPGGKPEVWIEPGTFDTRSTLGVLADEERGVLWVCSSDVSGIGVKGPNDIKGSYLKVFDLETGRGEVSYKLPSEISVCNDIAIGPDGAAYITNVASPEILKLDEDAGELKVWLTDDALKGGLDGLAFGEDGNLYVNTYNAGELFRVDVEDGEAKGFEKLDTGPLTKPDGMRPIEGGFVTVQGGGELSRISVDGDDVTIEEIGSFKEPTGVTVAGDTIWVAEGQLDYLSEEKKDQPRPDFHLRAVPLQ
ncbi:Virginiamycin B lyase [Methyloligella halotolerans]|uniref:Virginiamycin B lyase n=1 Tax=Methyloligella halotolerans TaxID=1177755 RepID=A0A1E2RYM0_9HYPH|nr:SMP-30/gluconolactonase/LRE family protein [Methyloligella halotolerans]ODA67311.1 Virginiamycin B lyase [Methyloligella halotolerans]